MRHDQMLRGRYLAVVLFTAIGLGTSGCGDTGSVSEPAALGNLSVSPGKLEPPFNPATTNYIARIPFDASSTTITASPRVSGDTIRFDNQQTTSQTVTLASPEDKPSVTIVVTETGAGSTSRSYRVQVEREVEDTALSALSVSPGTLAPSKFDKSTPDYSVNNIDNAITEVTISATKSDPVTVMQIASVTVPAGTTSGQATIRLGAPGSSTKASIVVTAPGGSKNTYTVTINRGASTNNFLRSLSVLSGTTALSLVPPFTSGSPDYTVNVASAVGSVSVTPRLDDATATMTVNGQSATSGQAQPITLLPAGQDTLVRIRVIAQDNSPPREYSVNVKRAALGGNNNLSALRIVAGTTTLSLSPSFDPNTLVYTVNVANDVSEVAVTATRQDATASIAVNGQPTNSGQARTITLNPAGQNQRPTTIPIVVIAQNGSQKTYTANVIRAALGGNNNLSALRIGAGTTTFSLSPSFDPNALVYTVNVANDVSEVAVTATRQDATASIAVNGQPTNSGQARTITLNPAGQNQSTTTIPIVVIAQNGSQKTYTANVIRAALGGNANLQNLIVSPGSLSPTFNATRASTDYDVNDVSSSAIAITVTATPQDSSATVTINSQGGNSRSIPLPTGPSTTKIEVRVMAPNGTDKPYTITVTQPAPAAPPAPTVAPDLIDADDPYICIAPDPFDPNDPNACDPTKSDATTKDNVTNATTPGFSIPSPGAGVTPKLWVDGVKDVNSTFTQGILRRSTSFGEGTYIITYNLTNDVGGAESGESPALDPPLRIILKIKPPGPK